MTAGTQLAVAGCVYPLRATRVRHLIAATLAVLAIALGSSTTRVAGQAGTPPILLVVNATAPNPFGGYLAEILRAEGVQSFSTVALSSVTASTLSGAKLVVLAETPLTAPQASLFTTYVNGGGRLVAMRPDAQLAARVHVAFDLTEHHDARSAHVADHGAPLADDHGAVGLHVPLDAPVDPKAARAAHASANDAVVTDPIRGSSNEPENVHACSLRVAPDLSISLRRSRASTLGGLSRADL